MKAYIIGILLVGSTILFSCGSKSEIKTMPLDAAAVPVKVISLNKTAYEKKVEASGQFTTEDETLLSFKTGGIIKQIFVKEGDQISAGQLLAVLDLTEIKAKVQQASLGLEKAKRDYQRVEQLYKDSVVTLENKQNAKTALEFAEAIMEEARFNLTHSEIRALTSGVVLRKMANAGQVISSGTPVIQTNGAGVQQWVLKVNVSDADWAAIQVGDKAEVRTDAEPNKLINGKVVRKAGSTDPINGSFSIEISLESGPIKAASGMFAKATIYIGEKKSGWELPYEAVLDANANVGYVFVVSDQNVAKKVAVQIGEPSKRGISILSGLEEYQQLIVSGSAYLKDQSKIKIIQ